MCRFKLLSRLVFFSLLVGTIALSLVLGSIIAQGIDRPIAQNPNDNLNLGKELYLENCSSCHIPIPAEVLPTKSWEKILKNPTNHYGQSLPKLSGINIRLIWQYLRTNSRFLLIGESTPNYVTNSRYFKALHPQVDLPKPATNQTCLGCHPGAKELEYRRLSQEWQ